MEHFCLSFQRGFFKQLHTDKDMTELLSSELL